MVEKLVMLLDFLWVVQKDYKMVDLMVWRMVDEMVERLDVMMAGSLVNLLVEMMVE